jgi:hypothetical protein
LSKQSTCEPKARVFRSGVACADAEMTVVVTSIFSLTSQRYGPTSDFRLLRLFVRDGGRRVHLCASTSHTASLQVRAPLRVIHLGFSDTHSQHLFVRQQSLRRQVCPASSRTGSMLGSWQVRPASVWAAFLFDDRTIRPAMRASPRLNEPVASACLNRQCMSACGGLPLLHEGRNSRRLRTSGWTEPESSVRWPA